MGVFATQIVGLSDRIMGQLNLQLQPTFHFRAFTINMNRHACFLARKEIGAEPSSSKNRQAKGSGVFWGTAFA